MCVSSTQLIIAVTRGEYKNIDGLLAIFSQHPVHSRASPAIITANKLIPRLDNTAIRGGEGNAHMYALVRTGTHPNAQKISLKIALMWLIKCINTKNWFGWNNENIRDTGAAPWEFNVTTGGHFCLKLFGNQWKITGQLRVGHKALAEWK